MVLILARYAQYTEKQNSQDFAGILDVIVVRKYTNACAKYCAYRYWTKYPKLSISNAKKSEITRLSFDLVCGSLRDFARQKEQGE